MVSDLVRTVSGLLYYGQEVLLHKHKLLDAYMGPGGKIDPHESEVMALEREIFEETGLTIKFNSQPIGDIRTKYQVPDSIVLIEAQFNRDPILDYTYFKQVDQSIRDQELKPEAGLQFDWYDIGYAINCLKLMPDTKQQLEQIKSICEDKSQL